MVEYSSSALSTNGKVIAPIGCGGQDGLVAAPRERASCWGGVCRVLGRIEFDGDGRIAWVKAVSGVSVASVCGEKRRCVQSSEIDGAVEMKSRLQRSNGLLCCMSMH